MLSKAKKSFVLQHDSSDCGVACLLSALHFFDGQDNLENLRKLSGTTAEGTTLLGLCHAAEKVGLVAVGYEAEPEQLKALDGLCILHLSLSGGVQHYVVCYGFDVLKQCFLIGDPAKGVEEWTEEKLMDCWKKVLLTLAPEKGFVTTKMKNADQRNWFLKLLKDDLLILVISALLGIVIAVLGLSTALFTQKLVDEIIPENQLNRLYAGLTMLFLLLVARAAIVFLRQHFLLQQAKAFNERITGAFLSNLLYLPKLFFDTRKTGDLISRLNDTQRIQKSVAYLCGTCIIDLLVVISFAAYLFAYHYSLGLTALLAIPLMGLIAAHFKNIVVGQNMALMGAYAANESNYIDTIQGISEIKAAGKEEQFSARASTYFQSFQSKGFALGKTGNRFNLFMEAVATVIILAILAEVSYLGIHGLLKIGEMMAVLTIAISFIPSCTRLMLTSLQIQEAKVAFNRMYEFASAAPEEINVALLKAEDWDEKVEELELKNISFRFAGRKQLLSNVNLYLNKGTITALLGESGCGKSTVLQIIQKFYQMESGEILVNNKHHLHHISTTAWRKLIGVVPQDIKIFNCSIVQNICLSELGPAYLKVIELCQLYGLGDYFDQFPQGLLTRVGEDGLNLSGGQKQIVGLMRALFKQPQVLLLDEPTASLDPKTEIFILNLLDRLKVEMCVLLITHKSSTAEIADALYMIHNGVSIDVRGHRSVFFH